MDSVQYAIVAYLRGPVGQFVEGLRREMHPKHAHLPAHITVLPPRKLRGTEPEALETMEYVCQSVLPFELVSGEIATFQPITPTVFIRIAHAAYRMRELHDRLNVGPLYADEPWPYMPHLTVAKMDTPDEAKRVYDEARRRWDEFAGTRNLLIEELTFVRQAGPDRWTDIAPIHLGTRLAPAS
jgi:2'-5' RNA ligase